MLNNNSVRSTGVVNLSTLTTSRFGLVTYLAGDGIVNALYAIETN